MESKKCYCPKCGSENLQTVVKTNVQTQGKNYSASQGCCGALMLGPFGLLCGTCGQGQQTTTTNTSMFACNDCGHEFKKREDLVKAVETAEKAKNIMIPVAGIFCVILFIISACVIPDSDALGLLFFVYLITFGVSASLGYYIYKKAFENAEAELQEYDRQQEKFSDKNN